jgi:3-mercaptopyruvate sulfurtransferase SseA
MSSTSGPSELARLSTRELARRRSDLVLVDAHGPPYFANGHIPGAVNIPPHDVIRLAGERIGDTRADVVVYGGASSSNARIVADQLLAVGYINVSLYEDGLEGWIAAGLPTDAADAADEADEPNPTPTQQLLKGAGSRWTP